MKSIRDLQLGGKRILLRADFNVPMDEQGRITDDIRIRAVLPTINFILEQQGRLIICSHMGRPGGKPLPEFSLAPVAHHLQELLGRPVKLAPDCVGEAVEEMVAALQPGEVMVLENLRFHKAETSNDPDFSTKLARFADVYINDAFAACHRAHASVVGVAERVRKRLPGFLLQTEMDFYHKAMDEPIQSSGRFSRRSEGLIKTGGARQYAEQGGPDDYRRRDGQYFSKEYGCRCWRF